MRQNGAKMFSKILIANRGEIACRIIKTAKQMGIQTVAVYSEADRDARHVELADEAIYIGPSNALESYLSIERIIAACLESGAQAVHPGYGFLSENAAFAHAVEEQGIVFIGPKHQAITAMGDKITAKKIAYEAGVNVIPGVNRALASEQEALEIAHQIGYPIMLKASGGGGGKGLRIAQNDQEVIDGLRACQNEARNSFGNDQVFIEKLILAPRHIEIQVLADAHGNSVHLWERECSIQRRHQKLIEEAPSPFLDEATRHRMGEQALALAKAVGYQSAGTVEFVVAPDKSFYFLEMNTRLQVEHPVTEMITGLDLVEWMIRIAAGEVLPFIQADIKAQGWAIECRLNAEDPSRNFLPSAGRLIKFIPPSNLFSTSSPYAEVDYSTVNVTTAGAATAHKSVAQKMSHALVPMPTLAVEKGYAKQNSHMPLIRLDSGVTEGSDISIYYDSMIGKLIVHAVEREVALLTMGKALDEFVIRGVESNLLLQRAIIHNPRFIVGDFNTQFLAEELKEGLQSAVYLSSVQIHKFITAVVNAHRRAFYHCSAQGGQSDEETLIVLFDEQEKPNCLESSYTVTVRQQADHACQVRVNHASYTVMSTWQPGQILYRAMINGEPYSMQIEAEGIGYRVIYRGMSLSLKVLQPHVADLYALMPVRSTATERQFLLSPMPGLLLELNIQAGQTIKAGEKIAIIEAMKMENILSVDQDKVVEEVLANAGERLSVNQPLLKFK